MKTLCDTGEPEDGAHHLDTFLRMPSHECAAPGTEWYERAKALYAAGCDAHMSIASEESFPELNTWVPAKAQGVIIRTTIDRADRMADGSWLVIDWKTGSYDPPEDTDRQLDLGHLALRTIRPQLRGDIEVRAIAWNLRTGKQRVRVLHREDARHTRDWAARMAQRLQSTTDFTATPSRACSFCSWRTSARTRNQTSPGSILRMSRAMAETCSTRWRWTMTRCPSTDANSPRGRTCVWADNGPTLPCACGSREEKLAPRW